MRVESKTKNCDAFSLRQYGNFLVALLVASSIVNAGCFLSNTVETYYGRVDAARAGEFRWSNGGLPQQFDPALAAAPPDTDAVRALYEGLTEYDPRNLAPVPAVALSWESSESNRVWTFFLRRDARWSNDDPVTAQDFVRSWQRVAALGDNAPHSKLLENISGVRTATAATFAPPRSTAETVATSREVLNPSASATGKVNDVEPKRRKKTFPSFGVEAVGDYTLRVHLQNPDAHFPALVAHTIFRPVHDESRAQDNANASTNTIAQASPSLVTNGAFRLSIIQKDSVVLERAQSYWDAPDINLRRVRFVAAPDAESALAAYRAGAVDAVTNAGFEPLALKMLAPYKDFRRTTYAALTFYEFNTTKPPFDDVRVRQALALAIDRERLSEDEMDGATEPAKRFLPLQTPESSVTNDAATPVLEHDSVRAKELLAAAGYPNGNNFPRIRLLVNRNDQQRAVAQAVAAMWRNDLGIATDVIVKDWESYETALRTGDYDVVRRGFVMQTPDEAINLRALFGADETWSGAAAASLADANARGDSAGNGEGESPAGAPSPQRAKKLPPGKSGIPDIATEARALQELPAVPLYFASSYALIKPYVSGFETNLLDAPLLKRVQVDTSWQNPAGRMDVTP
ncbi:MAG: peptide ABC transporter substrate-binding protein [Pyrinomonadaceae bacterium]